MGVFALVIYALLFALLVFGVYKLYKYVKGHWDNLVAWMKGKLKTVPGPLGVEPKQVPAPTTSTTCALN